MEEESEELNGQLASSRPETVRLQLRGTRRFVETRLKDLQRLLNGEPQTVRVESETRTENRADAERENLHRLGVLGSARRCG